MKKSVIASGPVVSWCRFLILTINIEAREDAFKL